MKFTINLSHNPSDEEKALIEKLNNHEFPEIVLLGSRYAITKYEYNTYRNHGLHLLDNFQHEFTIHCQRLIETSPPEIKNLSDERY